MSPPGAAQSLSEDSCVSWLGTGKDENLLVVVAARFLNPQAYQI